jgi:hypothetical protein
MGLLPLTYRVADDKCIHGAGYERRLIRKVQIE